MLVCEGVFRRYLCCWREEEPDAKCGGVVSSSWRAMTEDGFRNGERVL